MNKIAIVTGSSRGLGRDMALAIADKGLDVILTYNTQAEAAREVVQAIETKGRKAAALPLNLSKPGETDTFVAALKHVLTGQFDGRNPDFLVNNAGMGATIPMAQATEAQFDDFLQVHFKSVYFLTQKLLPLMNDGGGIVNISTGTTRFCNPGYSLYASMKGAVEVLTRYIAKEYGPRGIRANVVAPGPVETDFNNAAIRSNPQMKERLAGLTALGRVGTPDDIGGVVAFLCTDDAKWVTGQRIEVSGGINL